MTRTIKLHKLINCIRDVRGAVDPTGKWVFAPKPASLPRLAGCINRFRPCTADDLKTIAQFKNQSEMNEWVKGLP